MSATLFILNELNEYLYDNNIFNMEFTVMTNGDTSIYFLNEYEKFGWKIKILGDEDGIDIDLEEAHEELVITYNQMIIKQIKRNLRTIICDLQKIFR